MTTAPTASDCSPQHSHGQRPSTVRAAHAVPAGLEPHHEQATHEFLLQREREPQVNPTEVMDIPPQTYGGGPLPRESLLDDGAPPSILEVRETFGGI